MNTPDQTATVAAVPAVVVSAYNLGEVVSSEFASDERISLSTDGKLVSGIDCISVHIKTNLSARKIYGFGWVKPTDANAEYWVYGELRIWRDHSVVLRFPVAWGQAATANSVLPKSLPSVLTAGNLPCDNGLSLVVALPYNSDPQNVTMNAFPVQGAFDRISIAIQGKQNVADFRVFLGCYSAA